jgi:tetratricopeptide (TPR) repeat protein
MKDDTGELVAEPTKIEPTRSTDWAPEEQAKDEKVDEVEEAAPPPAPEPEPAPEPTPEPEPVPAPVAEKKPVPRKKEPKPAAPEPYKEPVTRKTTGMLEMPVDPILGSARAELTRSNIPGALETYGKLIKKGRFLEEVIYDLRDALYRYPVEVSIWQSLGDAYMRANQLQDALDAYTKAEELLR